MEVTPRLADLTPLFPPPAAPEPFIDRASELLALRRSAARSKTRRVIITGMGGIGKTALVAEYVSRMQNEGMTVAWLTPAVMRALPEQVSRLKRAFESSDERGIVVLDDAEDVEQIQKATPRAKSVQTIVTTRDASLAELGEVLAVEILPRREAAALIKSHAPALSQEDALQAAELLGALPLALVLAGRMVARTGWSEFQAQFGANRPGVTDHRERVISSDEDVRMARSNYERGLSLLKRGEYAEASARLESASRVLEAQLGADHPDTLAARSGFADALRVSGRPADAVKVLRDVVNRSRASSTTDQIGALGLEASLAAALWEAGMPTEALDVLVRVVPQMEQLLGSSHPDAIQAKTSLAVIYAEMGRLQEAAALQREALRSATEALGEDHRLTLTAMGNLASMLWDLGEIEEVEQLQRRLFDTSLSVLGRDHPDTLTAASNLASTLYYKGNLSDALVLEEMVFGSRRRVLGDDHPDTLAAANNLAFTLEGLGRPEEALLASETALAGYRRRAEAEPDAFLPALLTSLTNMASLLTTLGRVAEAEATIEEAIAISRHLSFAPQLAAALNNQSVVLAELNRREQALSVINEAVEIRRGLATAQPDEFRPGLASSLATESALMAELGRQEEAVTVVEEAVGIYRELSSAQQDALRTGLANVLRAIGRSDQEIDQELSKIDSEQ